MLLTKVLPFPESYRSVRASDRFLEPEPNEGTRGLTCADDDALATSSFLFESEGMRFAEVAYVDPASTCVGKEVVAYCIGLNTVNNVVVENCCRGVQRSGRGDFMDGRLSW